MVDREMVRAWPRWLLLTICDGILNQTGQAVAGAQESFRVAVLWRRAGGKQDGSNFDAPASTEVDAVAEGEFEAEPAA